MPDEVDLRALFDEYERTSAVNVLPGGKHKLKITSCTTKNNGLMPVFTPTEGPATGTRVLAGGIFPGDSEGGRMAFFRKLEKWGLGKDFFAQRPSLQDVAKALVGRVAEVEISVGDWQGEARNEMGFNIKLVEAPGLPAIGGVPQVAVPATPQVPTPSAVAEPAAPQPVADNADEDPGF